jgi:hypothetical protein
VATRGSPTTSATLVGSAHCPVPPADSWAFAIVVYISHMRSVLWPLAEGEVYQALVDPGRTRFQVPGRAHECTSHHHHHHHHPLPPHPRIQQCRAFVLPALRFVWVCCTACGTCAGCVGRTILQTACVFPPLQDFFEQVLRYRQPVTWYDMMQGILVRPPDARTRFSVLGAPHPYFLEVP